MRRSEAALIEVVNIDDIAIPQNSIFEGTMMEEKLNTIINNKGKIINVALVGNPNSGKTSLFNYASGSHEKVGNYG